MPARRPGPRRPAITAASDAECRRGGPVRAAQPRRPPPLLKAGVAARSKMLVAAASLAAGTRNCIVQFSVPNFLATPDSPSTGQKVLEQNRVVVMASIVCGPSLAVPLHCLDPPPGANNAPGRPASWFQILQGCFADGRAVGHASPWGTLSNIIKRELVQSDYPWSHVAQSATRSRNR